MDQHRHMDNVMDKHMDNGGALGMSREDQPRAWDVVDRPKPWAGTYDAVVAAAREAERQDSARRLRAWAASLPEPSAGLVALEAAEVVRGAR